MYGWLRHCLLHLCISIMLHAKTDVVVIGAGPGGLSVAMGVKRRDPARSVTLIEKTELASSLTSGSMASKTLLHLTHQLQDGTVTLTPQKIISQARDQVNELQTEIDELELQKLGIDVLKGQPEFCGRRHLTINDTKLRFKYAVIATGSEPLMVGIRGMEDAHVLTTDTIFGLKKIPKRLLIVGAGRTGLELAEAFSILGSHVSVVNDQPLLLPHLNKEVRNVFSDTIVARGIRLFNNAELHRVQAGTGVIQHDGVVSKVAFDSVLVASGRMPVFPDGLKKAGIKIKPEGIPTGLKHQTRNPRIFAIGDVASVSHFTHIAKDQAADVVEYICDFRSRFRHRPAPLVPAVLYTRPELATVGLSYKEARESGMRRRVRKIVVPYWMNDRAKSENNHDGVLTVVVKKSSGKIIGAQIAGTHSGELIGLFCLAMERGISLPELGSTLFPYPTYCELVTEAARMFYEA